MPLRYDAYSTGSTTLNTLVAGSTVSGNAVILGDTSRPKVAHLQAFVRMTIVTGSLTLTGKWQVSNDNSTWIDVSNDTQNAAGVAVAATANKSYPAPAGVYGWRYARFSLVTAGATAAAGDLYNIGYCLRTA